MKKQYFLQIFIEDHFAGTKTGLLHSISSNINNDETVSILIDLLNECVSCEEINNCVNRFDVVNRIQQVFKEILHELESNSSYKVPTE